MLILLAVVYAYFRRIPEPEYDKTPAKALGIFSRIKIFFRAYKMSFILQLFYSWMVIYTPIYLSAHIGFLERNRHNFLRHASAFRDYTFPLENMPIKSANRKY